jgi:parvulin-like peptidyl-prolyl isomerase
LAKKKKIEKAPREMTRRQISHHKQAQRRQRFIFIGGVVIIAAIILVITAGWVTSEYIPLHRTVIKVNDAEFTTADFIGYLEIAAVNQQSSGQQNVSLQQLAISAAEQMLRDELVRQAAEQLGITVTDDEAKDILAGTGLPVNTGTMAYLRAALLQRKLRSDYFGVQVPQSDNQVWSNVMLLESDVQAAEIRDRLAAGDNFTALAPAYALNYYSKNVNAGDFGWHPTEVLYDQLGSDIPLDFAFNSEIGSLSEPLNDAEMFKQYGYWLIKVLDQTSDNQSNVDALLVSNRVLANDVRVQLMNTENISAIADQYTQYTPSKEGHGKLGVVNKANMTEDFNNYVFSDNATVGEWSQPIVDDTLWTQGGSWLVKLLDREDGRALTEEDRNYLIGKRFDAWFADLETASAGAVNTDGLTDDVQQWAIDRTAKFLEKYQR